MLTRLLKWVTFKAPKVGDFGLVNKVYAHILPIKPIVLDNPTTYGLIRVEVTCFECGKWECSCE